MYSVHIRALKMISHRKKANMSVHNSGKTNIVLYIAIPTDVTVILGPDNGAKYDITNWLKVLKAKLTPELIFLKRITNLQYVVMYIFIVDVLHN